MPKKKDRTFTTERYNQIKEILSKNKVESYELESYIIYKDTRFLRHAEKISITDQEILDMINSTNKKTKFEELLKIARKESNDEEENR
jgi:tRNA splicing endonuclease